MDYIANTLSNLIHQTAFFNLTWGNYVMIVVACVFLYLAIRKGFEPLLLTPIAFGMLLVNIYPDIMMSIEESSNGVGGLLHYFYLLDEWAILPSLIFMGVGASTDFGPLIANPKSFLLGAAVHSFLLWRRKRAAWFPDLCVTGIAVPFLLIILSDALDRLIDQRKFDIPLIHQNPLIHSNLGLYVMIFSVAVFYVLLGTILAWVLWRLCQIFIRFSRKDS